jgi:two-component system nitrogen regulation response regulator GlnG
VADRPGAFEAAHRGTLFLDEVGNLSQDAQRMLLGVLQEGKVTRLGDVRERAVDVKVVVASHEDLGEMVRQGRFRPDLYMRLNPACTVQMPALRERMEDLPELMEFCVGQSLGGPYLEELFSGYAERVGLSATKLELALGDEVPTAKPGVLHVLLSDSVMRQLRRHPWSGNLREFAMTVENALTFTLAELEGVAPGHRADVIAVRPKLIRELLRAVRIEMGTDQGGFGIRVKIEAHDSLNELSRSIERQYFTTLYLQEEGDFAAMAQVLMGDASCARKVQLRFNQLGLRVRDLRAVGARVV